MIRKLVREAVIFMLGAVLLASVGGFIVSYRESPAVIWLNMTTSIPLSGKTDCYDAKGDLIPPPATLPADFFDNQKAANQKAEAQALLRPGETLGPVVQPATQGDIFDQIAAEQKAAEQSDPFAAYGGYACAFVRPHSDPPIHHISTAPHWVTSYNWNNFGKDTFMALLCGIWGFPVGLGLWGLYRMVHFAITG